MRGLCWMALAGCGGVELTESVPTNPNDDCPDAEAFALGLSGTSALGRVVSFASATPSPPDVGENTWVLTVTDNGSPVNGLAPTLRPWMPLHSHGLVPATYVGAEGEAGSYTFEPFDLIMPGLWEFTVDLGGEDTVIFRFCAEG